jgi:Cys-tRNA(Pro)/Cys-tRNA(Cys) deacylase
MEKTMVMKILEQKKLKYTPHYYDPVKLDACYVAEVLNQNPNQVFKTLVTVGSKYYVFMIPANKELDLKKAASFLKEKKIEMIKQKDLEPLTGYVHGGCSPIGMKKCFPTFIDESVLSFNTIFFSAGRIGAQIEISPSDLKKVVNYRTLDLCKE